MATDINRIQRTHVTMVTKNDDQRDEDQMVLLFFNATIAQSSADHQMRWDVGDIRFRLRLIP